ncbi:unnamed protein product [Ectocarpus sp. 13 AM-2016]
MDSCQLRMGVTGEAKVFSRFEDRDGNRLRHMDVSGGVVPVCVSAPFVHCLMVLSTSLRVRVFALVVPCLRTTGFRQKLRFNTPASRTDRDSSRGEEMSQVVYVVEPCAHIHLSRVCYRNHLRGSSRSTTLKQALGPGQPCYIERA